MRLSKDGILAAKDVVTEEVDCPEWGGSVLVRGMTGRERDEFEASILEQRGKQMVRNFANTRAKVVARCVVDDDGERLFGDRDVEALGAKSAMAICRIYEVAARLSGLRDEDIEELTQNFGAANGSSSSSALQPVSGSPSPGS